MTTYRAPMSPFGRVRRRTVVVVVVVFIVVVAACAPTRPGLVGWLVDVDVRRAALQRAVRPGAGTYAARRLAEYGRWGRGWDALPVANPRTVPVIVDEEGGLHVADRAVPLVEDDVHGDVAGEDGGDDDGVRALVGLPDDEVERRLQALGRAAFFRYPAQPAPFRVDQLRPAERAAFGLRTYARVLEADGRHHDALTCATCHAVPDAPGLANDALDVAGLMAAGLAGGVDRVPVWGAGRLDVTTGHGGEPALIPDLRPVRFQRHLQHSGALVQHDVTSLAVRLETLLVEAHGETVRPPRAVALGLALYLWSLADALPSLEDDDHRGARVFAGACGACHAGPGLAGGLVDVDVVGTDPTLARSPARGTGSYRTTSLRGVGRRRRLLHDGSVPDLAALLDPTRSHGGHRFGVELAVDERAALLGWLGRR